MPGSEDDITKRRNHWDAVYGANEPEKLSWFQSDPALSLELISKSGIATDAAIIDAGGGASTLADHLLEAGYLNITVADISERAIRAAASRLGTRKNLITWNVCDILLMPSPELRYRLWHDRAVFHFLVDPTDRRRYCERLCAALRPGGYAIIATFAPDGPAKCSGLEVRRYSCPELLAELGDEFRLIEERRENHLTPSGSVQKFIYALFRKNE